MAVCLAAIVFAMAFLFTGCGSSDKKMIEKGREYIREQENVNVQTIEGEIFAAKQKMFLEEVDEKLEEDPDYVWTALNEINTVIMGDSRAVAFRSYGFMDDSRVLADGGQSMKIITSHYEELQVINPNLVVLAYGLNDINWYWFSPEEFAEEMMQRVDEIRSMLPNAYIYIQSILPANEDGEQLYPNAYPYGREWNDREMEIYHENGYRTVDVSYLADENPEMYGDDGVHFYPAFYPLWAEAILKQYLADTMEAND